MCLWRPACCFEHFTPVEVLVCLRVILNLQQKKRWRRLRTEFSSRSFNDNIMFCFFRHSHFWVNMILMSKAKPLQHDLWNCARSLHLYSQQLLWKLPTKQQDIYLGCHLSTRERVSFLWGAARWSKHIKTAMKLTLPSYHGTWWDVNVCVILEVANFQGFSDLKEVTLWGSPALPQSLASWPCEPIATSELRGKVGFRLPGFLSQMKVREALAKTPQSHPWLHDLIFAPLARLIYQWS